MDIKYLVEFMYKGEINVEHVSLFPTGMNTIMNIFLTEQSSIVA